MNEQWGNTTPREDIVTTFAAQVRGRTFAITGTSQGGLGATAAVALSRAGAAYIILIARNRSKSDSVIHEIKTISPVTKVTFITCALDNMDCVQSAATEILASKDIDKIDVLLNNAGIMAIPSYTTNKHGVEMTLAANHVGHFLLTNLILPKILATGSGARIINHSSLGHKIGPFRFDDYNFSNGSDYDGWSAYGQSKTANILLTVELAKRLMPKGVQSFSCHPGSIYGTSLTAHLGEDDYCNGLVQAAVKNNGTEFVQAAAPKTLSQGTSTMLMAALEPELDSARGLSVSKCRVMSTVEIDGPGPFDGWGGNALLEPVYAYDFDDENARKFWAISEEPMGHKFAV